jgi:hypothetical protein
MGDQRSWYWRTWQTWPHRRAATAGVIFLSMALGGGVYVNVRAQAPDAPKAAGAIQGSNSASSNTVVLSDSQLQMIQILTFYVY